MGDIKMQHECVVFPCKKYIFMQDNVPCQGRSPKSTLRYITERGVNLFDWPCNSPDLNSIEEV